MSSPTSALEKGLVAWKAPLPPLLLLLLPLSGSWALSKAHHLQSVAGQTLSLRCQYPPKNGPYERKGWCKEVSELLCTGLVTSSRPHMLAQASRFSIWDSPSSGFFVVTMTGLREEDTGHYWCRIYPTSGYSVLIECVSTGHKPPPTLLVCWSVHSSWPRSGVCELQSEIEGWFFVCFCVWLFLVCLFVCLFCF
uniref:Natural cytotoxicity triggering receptor 2 n=2 Tax=Sus scrofa TaxID=9823 RepID=A0A8D0MJS0_PIG